MCYYLIVFGAITSFHFDFIRICSFFFICYQGHTLYHCMFAVLRAVGSAAADIWQDSIKPVPVWCRSRSHADPDSPSPDGVGESRGVLTLQDGHIHPVLNHQHLVLISVHQTSDKWSRRWLTSCLGTGTYCFDRKHCDTETYRSYLPQLINTYKHKAKMKLPWVRVEQGPGGRESESEGNTRGLEPTDPPVLQGTKEPHEKLQWGRLLMTSWSKMEKQKM